MKKSNLLPLAFIAVLFASLQSGAQTINLVINDLEIEVTKDTVAQIKSFTAKNVEGKTYLHWNVINQRADGTYVIYRSFDGENYEAIGLKDGIGVPIAEPIAYYYIDETPLDGMSFYKVIHFGKGNSFLVSNKVNVKANIQYANILR